MGMDRLNFLGCQVLLFIIGFLCTPLYLGAPEEDAVLISFLLIIVGSTVSLITYIFRLKNIGISGAWVLLMFIPGINIIFLLFLFFKEPESVEKKELKGLRKKIEIKELKKKLKELEEEE